MNNNGTISDKTTEFHSATASLKWGFFSSLKGIDLLLEDGIQPAFIITGISIAISSGNPVYIFPFSLTHN